MSEAAKALPIFVLGDSIPYLAARVGKLMEESFKPELKEAGLTIEMWRVLVVLAHDGPMTLIELSEATSVKSPTLSRLIGRMIDRRLISRKRSTRDTRTVELSILKAGEAMVATLMPRAAEIQDLAIGPFSPAETERLKRDLRSLYAVLEKHVYSRRAPREG